MTDEHILEQLYAPVVTFSDESKAILALRSNTHAGMMPIVSNVIDLDYFVVSMNVEELKGLNCEDLEGKIEQGAGSDAILCQSIEQDAGNTYPIVIADVVVNQCSDYKDHSSYLLAFKIGERQCISAQIDSDGLEKTNNWTTVFE